MGRREPNPDDEWLQGFIILIVVGLIVWGVVHFFF